MAAKPSTTTTATATAAPAASAAGDSKAQTEATNGGSAGSGAAVGLAPQKVTPFLMFTGRAEEAMTLYVSLFGGDSKIVSIARHTKETGGAEGSVIHATFTLKGLQVMAIDSPPVHAFTFTPASSLYVTCDTAAELDTLFAALSADGKVLMPVDKYPFSQRYGWCSDRFGVSWQLSLKP